uniref:Uncharacterized protein n=1 Tax=Romanomermis culicivorax TaxID=13658 RepID=A0A915K967_ROMCU
MKTAHSSKVVFIDQPAFNQQQQPPSPPPVAKGGAVTDVSRHAASIALSSLSPVKTVTEAVKAIAGDPETASPESSLLYELKYKRKKPKRFLRRILFFFCDILHCCCYVPCPPCPGTIVRKLAFRPPKSSYTFERRNPEKSTPSHHKPASPVAHDFTYNPGCERIFLVRCVTMQEMAKKLKEVDAYFIKANHTKHLASFRLKSIGTKKPLFLILHCHSNTVDIGMQIIYASYLAWRLACDVFEFDYSGYGKQGGISSGSSTEKNIILDVMAVYKFLTVQMNIAPNRIVVLGTGLGAYPAIHLAAHAPVRGLILESLLMSACRFTSGCAGGCVACCDHLNSGPNASLIKCPTLVIHGAQDELIDLNHAEQLFHLCHVLVPPLIIPNGDHYNMCLFRSYWNRLEIFIEKEMKGGGPLPFKSSCSLGCPEMHDENELLSPMHTPLSWPEEITTEKVPLSSIS